MNLKTLGMMAAGATIMFLFAVTLPRITTELDADPNTYLAPASLPADVRDELRSDLSSRTGYQREALGWKYTQPGRSGVFRPCRITEGRGRDADTDGLVDNLAPPGRWRKDWASVNPAVKDPDWATRTPAEREAALAVARRQVGVGSDFTRANEPFTAACDRMRPGVPRGPYYGRH